MAVLSNIRNRSGLLIVVIAFALFAFIIGDLIKSGGFGGNATDVGSINGKDISFDDFRLKVANAENNQQGITATAAANRVWEQEVSIALISEQLEKLGIRVGEKHVLDILKDHPAFAQNESFLTNGTFDVAKFKAYFKANPAELPNLTAMIKKDATLKAQYQIYISLVKAGLYVTKAEGKQQYELENNKVSFDYVAAPYSSINDSLVKISDNEIIAYMKEHKSKFKSEETRVLKYVVIEDKPSAEDENEIKAKVEALMNGSVVYNQAKGQNDTLAGFKNTNNIVEFINSNSDIPFDSTYVPKNRLPEAVADALFNLPAGATFGPYVNNGYYQVSKALGKKSAVVAQASHILIGYEGSSARNQKEKRTKEEAKAKAEEILAQVTTNPDSFMMLAFTTSDDPSAQRGGDLGEFGPNQMVKPFNDFVFNNSVGKIGLVETKFGFHIVKVTGKQDGIKLATLAQKIIPSESTSNKTFTQATQFEMDAASKDFEQLAKDNKLTVSAEASILAMGEQLGSLGNQRNIIRWAFGKDAEAGSIKRFEVANVGNVIVKLISVDNSGFIPLAQARPRVESILKNKKKAEQLTEKLKGTSLDAIAKAAASKVEKATDLSIASPNVNGSNEAKVVATAYTTKANTVSAPIEGISGVYVIKNIKSSTAAAPTDLKAYTDKLKAQSAGDLGRIMTALKGNAEIEDNRSAFNF